MLLVVGVWTDLRLYTRVLGFWMVVRKRYLTNDGFVKMSAVPCPPFFHLGMVYLLVPASNQDTCPL